MTGAGVKAKLNVQPADTDWTINAARDLDGDGKADIVFRNVNGNLAVWLMNGAAIKDSNVLSPPPASTWQVQP
jgi:hypothetical protein